MQDKKFDIVMHIKISNDKKIILFKTQKIQSETGSFQEMFTQELKKMDRTLLDFKLKRKYNKSLIKEKQFGLYLSKNANIIDVNKERKEWYNSLSFSL